MEPSLATPLRPRDVDVEIPIRITQTYGRLALGGAESESDYLFNDVGNQPHEGISQRHATRRPKDQAENVGGFATLGSLSGAGFSIRMSKWFAPDMAGKNVWPQSPNPVGPNDCWVQSAVEGRNILGRAANALEDTTALNDSSGFPSASTSVGAGARQELSDPTASTSERFYRGRVE